MVRCLSHTFTFPLTLLGALMVLVSTAWADTVETAVMPGRVIEGHAKWEEDCAKCHKRFNKAAQTHLCQDCHKEVHKDIEQKQGFHGRFKVQR